MEKRKDMPEEVKNQVIGGKKRVVTKEMPEKFKKKFEEKSQLKRKRIQEYLQLSLQLGAFEDRLVELRKELNSVNQSLQTTLTDSAKKLRLNKDKERTWRFDGKGNFIGIYNPPKKSTEKK